MTFARKVKDELIKNFARSEGQRKAEVMALFLLNKKCIRHDEETGVYIYEEPLPPSRKGLEPRRKTYNIKSEIDLTRDPKKILKNPEEKRAFLRGAFLAAGTVSDPEKGYHFEIQADEKFKAEGLLELMKYFNINAKIMKRRSKYAAYIKDGTEIVDILNVLGAHVALMDFENVRILKEMRGTVNRQVNCETANISKTIAASMKQLEDIEMIKKSSLYDDLDESIKEICEARINNPDVPLSKLGDYLNPPIGKSGVNHRFRKISRLAEEIRGKRI